MLHQHIIPLVAFLLVTWLLVLISQKKLEMLLIFVNEILIVINVEQSKMVPEGKKLFLRVKSFDLTDACMIVVAAWTPTNCILLFI